MFDAGSIVARLEITESDFDRSLSRAEYKVKRFEREPHIVRISAELDEASISRARRTFANLDRHLSQDATQRLRSSPHGSVLGSMLGLLHGGGDGGRAAITPGGGAGGSGFVARLAAGIGPLIMGMGVRTGALVGLGAPLLGAVPALAGALAPGAVGLLGAGVLGLGAKELIGQKNRPGQAPTQGPLYDAAKQASAGLSAAFKQGLTPLIAPLRQVLGEVPRMVRSIVPDLKSLFSGAATLMRPFLLGARDLARDILPGLGTAFRAAAPSIRPLLDGVGMLVKGVLPGLVTLLRAASPAVHVFAQILGSLGRDVGGMFSAFAPVLRQSSVLLRAVLGVVGALFPIIGKLAAIMARALAPVFTQFASVIRSLLPFLTIIGHVVAELAGAILGDLVAAFTAVARLLRDVAPSFAALARAVSNVFKVLENSGIFAILGDALERLAGPLAKLINSLVRGLLPILPPVVNFISKLSSIIVAGLVRAVEQLLPSVTKLATAALGALAVLLPVVIPLFTQLAAIFTGAVVRAVSDLATALAAIINAIPPTLLRDIIVGIIAIAGALKLWAVAQGILDVLLSANPIGLIAIAIAALVIGIVELAKHWKQIWGDIRNWAMDAWNFLTHGWGQYLIPGLTLIRLTIQFVRDHWRQAWNDIQNWARDAWNFLTHGWGQYLVPGLTLIRGAISFLRDHWRQMWGDIQGIGKQFWQWLWNDFGAKVMNFLLHTIPNAFSASVRAIGNGWQAVKNVVEAPVKWVVDNVIDGLISAFDWISSKVGGPHIRQVHPFGLAAGGRIQAGTTGTADDVLVRVSKGETVVSAAQSRMLAPLFSAMGVPGYASGGLIPGIAHAVGSFIHSGWDTSRIITALVTGNSAALVNAFHDLMGAHGTGGAIGDLGRLLTAIPRTLIHDAASHLIGLFGGGGGLPGSIGGLSGVAAGPYQTIAAALLPAYGLARSQFGYLIKLWNQESGWNPHALNPSSGAYGIPQALPASKMASAGADWLTNATTQIRWGLGYIRDRYGSLAAAWGHEVADNWYDSGGWLVPGASVAINGTGMREAVLQPGESRAFQLLARQSGALLSAAQGGGGTRQIAEILNIMLPEGATVAQAMAELAFRMRVAEQQNFAGSGVLP